MKIVLSLLLLLASDTQFVMAEEVNDMPYSQCTIYYQTKLNNHLIKEEKGIILVTNDDKKEPFVTSRGAERKYIKEVTTNKQGLQEIQYGKVTEGFTFLTEAKNIPGDEQHLDVNVETALAILLSVDKVYTEDDQRNYIEIPNRIEKKFSSKSKMKIGEEYHLTIRDSAELPIKKLYGAFSFADESKDLEFNLSMKITDCQKGNNKMI